MLISFNFRKFAKALGETNTEEIKKSVVNFIKVNYPGITVNENKEILTYRTGHVSDSEDYVYYYYFI